MPKILVVEDNALNMKLFEDMVCLLKCDIISTTSGSNALELCIEHLPDLVLMDIQLDGISGTDIIRSIKLDARVKDIPIIAISAYAMKNEEMMILQSGCDKYLSKPLAIEEFFSSVQYFLNRDTA
ncbi:MAG: response regulator [Alphaproteobacteria bacterium]|nr:response regulator [Alphaproteobacteria bacterium]